MADKTIGELPGITSLDSGSLFVAQQQGAASKVTGAQLIQFANVETAAQVSAAQAAAQEAAASETAAETAKNGAETAQTAIENMTVEAETLAAGAQATVQKIVTSGQPIKLLFGLPTGPTGPAGGVNSFNGRTGAVMPQKGDYTAEMVGAAPSGFGLGAPTSETLNNDWNNALVNGFYRGKTNSPDGQWWFGQVLTYGNPSPYCIVQRAYRQYSSVTNTTEFTCAERRAYSENGGEPYIFTPWEYVNPPMVFGVEYRTIERYNGKPVYTKLVDCGAMPNNTAKNVEYSVDTNCQPISVNGTWSNGKITMPGENGSYAFPGELQSISASNNVIILVTHSDRSNYTANATVKYWKTTD